jgi:hypothetical protein
MPLRLRLWGAACASQDALSQTVRFWACPDPGRRRRASRSQDRLVAEFSPSRALSPAGMPRESSGTTASLSGGRRQPTRQARPVEVAPRRTSGRALDRDTPRPAQPLYSRSPHLNGAAGSDAPLWGRSGGLSSTGRASECGSEGYGFETHRPPQPYLSRRRQTPFPFAYPDEAVVTCRRFDRRGLSRPRRTC